MNVKLKPMNNHLPFLWLCGAIGVGKSSVGWEMFSQLREEEIKSGYADADQLGLCYPCPDDDPVNQRVKSRDRGYRPANHDTRDPPVQGLPQQGTPQRIR